MRSILLAMAAMFAMPLLMASTPSDAAELAIRSERSQVVTLRARYPLRCSSQYSCYSLYGAYGPWGGRAYWAEFSPVVPRTQVVLQRAY